MEPQDLRDGPLGHVELTKGLALVLDRPTGHHGGRLDLIGHILVPDHKSGLVTNTVSSCLLFHNCVLKLSKATQCDACDGLLFTL